MRVSALLESNPAAAARGASTILASFPGQAEAQLLLATACQRLGDPATARAQLEPLVRAQPASPTLQLELARAYAAGGQSREAIGALQAAVKLDARLADAWRELAAQHFVAGDTLAGDTAYAHYMRLVPSPPELADAAEALSHRRFDSAEGLLRRRLQQFPNDVPALYMLAEIATKRGDYLEAERLLRLCLKLAPGHAEARFNLASELSAQQRQVEALPLVERLLAADPVNASYLALKAQVLRLSGEISAAFVLMQQAMAAGPDNAQLRLVYGHMLRETGENEKAIEAYRQAIAMQPGLGEAYWSLANLKTLRFTAADVEQMQQQLPASARLSQSRICLEFALGKALEDAGQFEPSFRHYAEGNAMYRAGLFYHSEVLHEVVERSKALYVPSFFAARSGWGSERRDPIFVVGMPRSGSTLLEQILASHSQVEGTHELLELPLLVQDLEPAASGKEAETYPGIVAALDKTRIEALAARYLERAGRYRQLGRPRFVDKLLGNFVNLGLIHLMFPRATIIDARRHPLACGFSCYKQLFARGLYFAYDQEELGHYLRDYIGLMEHMDTVLPGRVYRLHYEQLVADPEGELRRLLDHLELPFEDGCLRFYENRRVVKTVSSEQVRRPIHQDAVAQWRHFEPWLGTLRAVLGDLVASYPAFPRPRP